MFPKRSIKTRFVFQILVASAALLIIFSSILYIYIQQSIYEERKQELIKIAQNITHNQSIGNNLLTHNNPMSDLSIHMVQIDKGPIPLELGEKKIQDKDYLLLYYPFDLESKTYLRITKDFTQSKKMLKKILNSIFVINAISFLFIILYAFVFGAMLMAPINALTERLGKMNENFINPIELGSLPIEFLPLGRGINMLIKRIQTFVKYQKELFIGAAHELKTPLAVMKLKNEVTLIKERDIVTYIEALKTTNDSVNAMNQVVAQLLNVGRQEGAQFESPIELDLIKLIKHKVDDFMLIAQNEQKNLIHNLRPQSFVASIQKSLLDQIIQNFLQNALRFTPKGKTIFIESDVTSQGLEIRVIDEGEGVDESMDFFAPFKRAGEHSGVGLGLFLAKSAADALHAHISIMNREDKCGTVATLILNTKLSCRLPNS